jgi:hypothetical protein
MKEQWHKISPFSKKIKLGSVLSKSPHVLDLLRTARVCIVSRSVLAVIEVVSYFKGRSVHIFGY